MKYINLTSLLIGASVALTFASCQYANSQGANSTNGKPGVYFINLKDGDKVHSPFVVQMGINGMTVEPAGFYNEGKGHHHLIIDGSWVDKGDMVPKDGMHLHFGKGQTVDTLSLPPGDHTLTLQFADGFHRSYGKEWSSTIKVTVE